jgi:outer membrane protein assembly factor BamA
VVLSGQVTANPELRGVVARGANMLPTAVVQRAFRPLYGGPLNFVAFSKAVEKLDDWYRARGILGQVICCQQQQQQQQQQLVLW